MQLCMLCHFTRCKISCHCSVVPVFGDDCDSSHSTELCLPEPHRRHSDCKTTRCNISYCETLRTGL